jgi:hypothetical protein
MKLIAEHRKGILGNHNLWIFWDNLGVINQNRIIEYYKAHPGFWDYNTLFQGSGLGDLKHGDINKLSTLFVLGDLDLCDIFFHKFISYSCDYYLTYSDWGKIWWEQYNELKADPCLDSNLKQAYESITPEDIYWVDTHFFLFQYSGFVYKNYLKGNCSIERFEKAFFMEYTNLNKIQKAIQKLFFCNIRNGIIDQYLIYLEKQKRFDECIKIINEIKNTGWANEFEKRLSRCVLNKNKIVP